MQIYVAECVEMDQSWAKRDDLRPRDVSVWLWARAFWGLRLLLEESSPDHRWAGWTSSSKAWSPSRLIVHRKEACRMISARTDDRGFVALLNEAMAVVLPGEPIPRAKADRVRMLVDAVQHG